MPGWPAQCCGGWIWWSKPWPSWTRCSPTRSGHGQHQIELLQTIPGVGPKVAQVIIAETGADMARFPTAAHLAAWAGLAPAMHESAGKQSPAGKRHGNKWLSAILVEAAGSVGRMHDKNHLGVPLPIELRWRSA
jgi:transposase